MLTFKLDVSALDSKKATDVADLTFKFRGGVGSCLINKASSGTVVEIVDTVNKLAGTESDADGITLFGASCTIEDLAVQDQGIVDYLPTKARWFVFLAAAHGFCQLQSDHQKVINVMGIGLDRLIELYQPKNDREREGIEQQLQYFALSEIGVASTFF